MESKNRNNLFQLRSTLLKIKRHKLPETENEEKSNELSLLFKEYEDYLIETTLYVLQGGLDIDEFPKKGLLESAFEEQNEKADYLLDKKKMLNELEALIKLVVSEDLIRITFDSVTPHTKFTPIFNANGQLEAESLKLFLNSLGFPVRIYQESAGVVYGLTVGPLGLAEIMVPEGDEEQANDILTAMEEGLFIQEEDEESQDFDDPE